MNKIIEQPRFLCPLAAQQTVLGIDRAIPIVHAGPGCSSKIYEGLGFYSGFQGEGYGGGSHIPSTNFTESEVIFGGEEKLRKTIEGTLKVIDADLFVVLTGCTSDIIGDDVNQVVSEFQNKNIPIISVETGGFKGNNYRGHELVMESIIEQFVGEITPKVRNGLVNIFSIIPFQDPYWRGDLDEIKILLEKIGLEVNILFGYSSKGISEWKDIPNAQFNLLISPWNGISTVKYLKQKYGTPFLHYKVMPIGAIETSKFLKTVGSYAGIDSKKVDNIIEEENKKYYKYFESLIDFITINQNTHPSTFYTVADATYSLSISNFLIKELGYIPKIQFVIDNPNKKYNEIIKDQFQSISDEFETKVVIEDDGGKIKEIIKATYNKPNDTVIIGSSWEKQICSDIGAYLIYISWPINHKLIVNKTYVGYSGGLTLIEDIYSKILEKNEG